MTVFTQYQTLTIVAYHRAQLNTLIARLRETPERIIALFGPRQTGKSTIAPEALRRTNAPSRYLSVDKPDPGGLGAEALAAGDIW